MKKVFCFGELLLRMSPYLHKQWIHKASMPVYIGGAELNVATALTKWNVPVKYLTVLPDNYLSKEVYDVLNEKNIDTSSIIFSGNRTGIYFLAQGQDLKHAGVIYDRSHSSFSELKPNTINWDDVLNDANWFHFSAISPALNANIAEVCKEAITVASKKGITISVDLNYRAKLWQYGKNPVEIMPALVEHCDVIMGNIWSANSLLGINVDETIHSKKSKDAYFEHADTTAKAIMKKFPKCKTVAHTFRFDDNNGIRYYAVLNNAQQQFASNEYYTNKMLDKIGSGDCFMAGLIYGLYNQLQPKEIINFATAAAYVKLHEIGDSTNKSVDDIKKVMLYETNT